MTRDAWDAVWSSPVAHAFGPHHRPAFRCLAIWSDRLGRARAAVGRAFMVKGSMDQVRVNPALQAMVALDSACLRLENELGLTPMSEARLGLTVGQAERTLEELNRAAREAGAADDEDPVADLLALQTGAVPEAT